MSVCETFPTATGTKLMLVETSTKGGGRWGRPGFLNLVELPAASSFHSVSGRNVLRVLARVAVDVRHTGPRSHFGREWSRLRRMAAAVIAAESEAADQTAMDAGLAALRECGDGAAAAALESLAAAAGVPAALAAATALLESLAA